LLDLLFAMPAHDLRGNFIADGEGENRRMIRTDTDFLPQLPPNLFRRFRIVKKAECCGQASPTIMRKPCRAASSSR